MTEQLKALAEAAKNWHVNHAMPENDDGIVEVGHMLDGEFYPIVIVDCVQYDQSSQPLAAYIAAANPERILALIAENERADKLLQQALEAVLDEHLPGFTEDAPRQHDDVIYDKAIEDAADAIQQLIARTYLEGKK